MSQQVGLGSGGSGGYAVRTLVLSDGTYSICVGSGGAGAGRDSGDIPSTGTAAIGGDGGCSSFARLVCAGGGGGGTGGYRYGTAGSPGSPNGNRGRSFSAEGSNEDMRGKTFTLAATAGPGTAGGGGGATAKYAGPTAGDNGGPGRIRVTYLGPIEEGERTVN